MRPQHLTDKCGNMGSPVQLLANYFRLVSLPQWCVHQYHVDVLPLVESSRVRRALINDFRERFGRCFVFDGMSDLKKPTLLRPDPLELQAYRPSDGAPIVIRF
ncbi:piwi-like protein Siwi [Dermacentor albipictus]|uniref:piwi-like protein Siwi n=1 Tax=Dermacentor albipictus TaxID=60249 RepID=UPI0038FC9AE8